MSEEKLKKEIAKLEEEIRNLEERRPDHDHTGWFAMEMLRLTEELDEKRRALKALEATLEAGENN